MTAYPAPRTPLSRHADGRNLSTLPWTVAYESTLFGVWWVIVPTADTHKGVPQPNAATIDTCGHQHPDVDALMACPNLAQLREVHEAHEEGLAEYERRLTAAYGPARIAAAFRRGF